jgi:hypothetical protein
MFEDFAYTPTLGVRPSEMEGLRRLPDFDKDALLPNIRLRKWRNSGTLEKSFDQITQAVGGRPIIIDLDGPPREVKNSTDEHLVVLNDPEGGHAAWVALLQSRPNMTPTVQWGGSAAQVAGQATALLALGRGISIRLRKAHQWDWAGLSGLRGVQFGQAPVMVVLDFGQITARTDVTAASAEIAGIAAAAAASLGAARITVTVAASSFPAEFASINRTHARLPIRERGLFTVLGATNTFGSQGLPLLYGDFASVCCAKGSMARGGAPRVDLVCRNEWAYFRREEDQSYVAAARAAMGDRGWQNDLVIWGTNEIRRAAGGDLENLHYPQRWVTTRINAHLHHQIHYGAPGALLATDEPYQD